MRWPFGGKKEPTTPTPLPPEPTAVRPVPPRPTAAHPVPPELAAARPAVSAEEVLVDRIKHWLAGPYDAPDGQTHLVGQHCPVLRDYVANYRGYSVDTTVQVHQHLLAHVINDKVGQVHRLTDDRVVRTIPIAEVEEETRALFNDCYNPALMKARGERPEANAAESRDYRGFGPEQWGLTGTDAEGELIVNAIYVYLASPNTIKTLAPDTARTIRAAVNPNPAVNGVIMFI